MADEKEKQEQKGEELQIPDTLPLLPIRDIVIFPFMIVPLFVGREKSIYAVDSALAKERLVFLTTQKDISNEEPEPKDLYQTGTVGMVMRMLKLPDGRVKVLIQGLARGIIKEYTQEKPGYIVNIEKVKETPVLQPTPEVEALMRNVREQLEKLASLGKTISPEIMMIIET
ncbi:MAG: LON peptidase substrate-binding domain-containing protein, partial [Deltaproteobacteria bacterium]